MKILIVGMGSIGTRHYNLIKKHYPKYEVESFTALGRDWDEVKKRKFDVGFICSPTHLHITHALQLAELGMAIFCEKPLDCSTKNLERLVSLVKEKRLITYLAYPFRHHPDIKRLKQFITERNISNAGICCYTDISEWQKEYSKDRKTGGGAILELSHEIDLAEYLFGKIVNITGVITGQSKIISAEPEVYMTAEHENGDTTSIHLDLESKCAERYIVFSADKFHISLDYSPTEEMWCNQLTHFFYNVGAGHTDIDNSIPNASFLFKKIIDFRKMNSEPSNNNISS